MNKIKRCAKEHLSCWITSNMNTYKISFWVTGTDHSGYCSGNEGEEIEPYSLTKFVKVDRAKDSVVCDSKGNISVESLNLFSDYHSGCTSGGSGYCNGCKQNRQAIKGIKIEDTDSDESESDTNDSDEESESEKSSEESSEESESESESDS